MAAEKKGNVGAEQGLYLFFFGWKVIKPVESGFYYYKFTRFLLFFIFYFFLNLIIL